MDGIIDAVFLSSLYILSLELILFLLIALLLEVVSVVECS